MTHCANNYGFYQFPEKLVPLVITNVLRGHQGAGVWRRLADARLAART